MTIFRKYSDHFKVSKRTIMDVFFVCFGGNLMTLKRFREITSKIHNKFIRRGGKIPHG